MSKNNASKKADMHKDIYAFVNNIFEKNYAQANAHLTQAVKDKLTQRVNTISKEIK